MSKRQEQQEQQDEQIFNLEDETVAVKQKTKKHIAAATIAKLAILTAISWILYIVVKFPIPF